MLNKYTKVLLREQENLTVEDLCPIICRKIQVARTEKDEKIKWAISAVKKKFNEDDEICHISAGS